MINTILIQQGVQLVLEGLGVDPNDHNFASTPERAAKVFQEVFQPTETEWPVFDEDYTDMVIMRGHTFFTFCPHHLLPVKLVSSVAYLPNGRVIGASKLIRMIHDCNLGPMTQEMLTARVANSIDILTNGTSSGCAVCLEGRHGCMEIRGVRSGASMITTKFTGIFETDIDLQGRFFRLIGGMNGG
jgi:GTP cyclohydrolase I